ncbi:TetR/AcrR family transcriptional regulator [Winogradskya humida]|uniref:HTH tetR-type domain-containing protein n=1 Tax=Winogradskya humida TaxID=113566 RepID=A0ABQ3ZWR5_9ACTN|nr:TetR family transcriptional regulator [Actinoplanes humidus]GIE23041.1 hypothetical protein Ahu01nite_061430 [Actinoplanes humidus]
MPDATAAPLTKRVDPRVRRTRALLRTAALELAAQYDWGNITIAHVADRATINRATVYQHYSDLESLLVDAMEDELTGLVALLARCPLPDGTGGTPAEFADVFRHVESQVVLYRRMLGPCGSARFMNRLQQLVAAQVEQRLTAEAAETRSLVGITLRGHCAAGAFIGVLRHWLTSPELVPAETMAIDAWHALSSTNRTC